MPFCRDVLRDHLRPLFALEIRPDQKGQVAPNAVTLAQAAYEPGAAVWGLWDGETAVGLLAMIDTQKNPDSSPQDADAAYIWRLMVDADQQGKGYGARALGAALGTADAWQRPRLVLTAVDNDGGAIPFYERFGFVQTGRVVDGEREMTVPSDVLRNRLLPADRP